MTGENLSPIFRLIILTLFIDQFVHLEGGEGIENEVDGVWDCYFSQLRVFLYQHTRKSGATSS